MIRLTGLLAALLAIALLVSACSSDAPKPNFSSVASTPAPTSSGPSPTGSLSPTANVPSGATSPSEPPSANQNTSDGAFAFVAYYWKKLDWAYSTVDGDVIQGLYEASCKSCESSRDAINDVQAKGNTFRGGHLSIRSQALATTEADPGASFAIDTKLSVESLSELSDTGREISTFPSKDYTVRVFVAWVDGRFVVTATANLGVK